MKPCLVVLLLLNSVTTSCQARLGDSETRCISKYGSEFDVQENLGFDAIGDKAASFHLKIPQGRFVINVTFLQGIAVEEKVTREDASLSISEEQKTALLQSESAGLKWESKGTRYRTDRQDTTSGIERWVRSDGAMAICWLFGSPKTQPEWGEIDFSTREYADAQGELDRRNGAR